MSRNPDPKTREFQEKMRTQGAAGFGAGPWQDIEASLGMDQSVVVDQEGNPVWSVRHTRKPRRPVPHSAIDRLAGGVAVLASAALLTSVLAIYLEQTQDSGLPVATGAPGADTAPGERRIVLQPPSGLIERPAVEVVAGRATAGQSSPQAAPATDAARHTADARVGRGDPADTAADFAADAAMTIEALTRQESPAAIPPAAPTSAVDDTPEVDAPAPSVPGSPDDTADTPPTLTGTQESLTVAARESAYQANDNPTPPAGAPAPLTGAGEPRIVAAAGSGPLANNGPAPHAVSPEATAGTPAPLTGMEVPLSVVAGESGSRASDDPVLPETSPDDAAGVPAPLTRTEATLISAITGEDTRVKTVTAGTPPAGEDSPAAPVTASTATAEADPGATDTAGDDSTLTLKAGQNAAAMPASDSGNLALQDTVPGQAADTTLARLEPAIAEPPAAAAAVVTGVPQPGPDGRWIINLASYSGPNTAARMQRQFAERGVSTEQQVAEVNGKTMYRLRIAAFTSRRDAQAYFDSIKQQLGMESAWITKQ